ncbi:MAG: hypothetical protein J6039_00090 [Alphaproteobacteria bacterium]|nr:hypothetical protein [Alphaproteobacteria bacterium]
MKIININGPINSGKTTVSKLLKESLPNCLFIEVDELLSDEEQEKLKLGLKEGWAERLRRLDETIGREKELQRYQNVVFAYPMTDKLYEHWKLWQDENTQFVCITLAPKMEICMQNRGERELTDWEKQRIAQMYAENYQAPQGADLIIDNGKQTPQETADSVMKFLKARGS